MSVGATSPVASYAWLMKLVFPAPLALVHCKSTAIGHPGVSKCACDLLARMRKLHTELFELWKVRCGTSETPSGSFRVMPTLAVCNRCRRRITEFVCQDWS